MKKVIVTTSWDDGHVLDLRVAALLTKYGIKGTFYIAPDNVEFSPRDLLDPAQIQHISETFEIGAHTMIHHPLPELSDIEARREITRSKAYLENLTRRQLKSFCYPHGDYTQKHVAMVREAGFTYARTVHRHSFSADRSLEAQTSIHTYNHFSDLWKIARFAHFNPAKTIAYFQWDNLAIAMFDRVLERGGIFHLWGHSWEIDVHHDWEKLERVLQYIAGRTQVTYVHNGELAPHAQKLLIAIPYFPPYHGGTQMYAYNIATRLQQEFGWELCIATSGGRGFRVREEEYKGLKVYRVPYWFKLSNTPVNFLWPWLLRRIIRNERISVINAHTPVPFMSDVIAVVKGRRPLVLTYHTGSMQKMHGVLSNLVIWLYEHGPMHWQLRRAAAIVCPSDFVRLGFLRSYVHKSTTITPGVDTDLFMPGYWDLPHQTILFIAGLTRAEQHKGLPVLIEAFHRVHERFPNLRLVIGGDGNMRPAYEASVAARGLQDKVIFKGRVTAPELTTVYQQCTMFVLPSLSPAESFGMVLIEAMASGKPVIGSISGGIPWVIEHEKTGLLVPSNDAPALASAITRLLSDPPLVEKLVEAGLQEVKAKYNWHTLAAKHHEIFMHVLRDSAYEQ